MSFYEMLEFESEYDILFHNPVFLWVVAIIGFVAWGLFLSENRTADKYRKKKQEEFYNNPTVFEVKMSRKAEQVCAACIIVSTSLYMILLLNSKTYFLLEFTETVAGYMAAIYIIFLISFSFAISACQYARRDTILKYNYIFITEDTIYAASCKEKGRPIVFKKEISGIKDVIALKNRKGFEIISFESLQIRTESKIYEIEGIIDAHQVKYLIEKRQNDFKSEKEI